MITHFSGIPLRGSEAYLPRQVGLRRWTRGFEWGHFGGEAEVREYATDGEGIGDAGEQGAVAVAVWAAQDVLVKYAREQFGPAIGGGGVLECGGQLGRIGELRNRCISSLFQIPCRLE